MRSIITTMCKQNEEEFCPRLWIGFSHTCGVINFINHAGGNLVLKLNKRAAYHGMREKLTRKEANKTKGPEYETNMFYSFDMCAYTDGHQNCDILFYSSFIHIKITSVLMYITS